MNPERWSKLVNLFLTVHELEHDEQERFIASYAESDSDLAAELKGMLDGNSRGSILDMPVAGPLMAKSMPERLGPYQLVRQLGTGGMGSVYLAWREDWERHVAIKLPNDNWISASQLDRFQREQRLLAQLTHPNIARIYDGGTQADGTPWFAMEFVNGEPVTEYCRNLELTLEARLQLFRTICNALEHAHSHLIVHRDLKPSNILVAPEGNLKLLDFGIAQQLNTIRERISPLASSLNPITIAYSAPEQIRGREMSTKTDIYALGVILYELLTGELPFQLAGLDLFQARDVVLEQEPTKPSDRKTRIAGLTRRQWIDLDAIVLKALDKNPEQRYVSVEACRRDIEYFLTQRPVEAGPRSKTELCIKFVLRNRKRLSIAGAALAVFLSMGIAFTVEITRARTLAVQEAQRTRGAIEFTRNMLSGGDSDVGPSNEMRVTDALADGLKQARRMQDEPIQRAQILTTIGSAYEELGRFRVADDVLHEAYRLFKKYEPGSRDLSEALLDLGKLFDSQFQSKHARECFQKALDVAEHTRPTDPLWIYRCKIGLAMSSIDPKEALRQNQELDRNRPKGVSSEALGDVWNNLATAYIDLGEYAKADPYAVKVLAYSRSVHPSIHPDIAVELTNLALIERELKNYPAAEHDLRECLNIFQTWYPKGHKEIADTQRALANVLYLENQFDKAMPLARQALEGLQNSLGPNNRLAAYAMQNVGAVDLSMPGGNLAEAVAMFRKEIFILNKSNEVTNVPFAYRYLGDAYMAEKKYKDGEQAYRTSLDLCRNSVLATPYIVARTRHKLADALMFQGRYLEAETPLLESYDSLVQGQTNPWSRDELNRVRKGLVSVYVHLQRSAEADRYRDVMPSKHQ